jgi:hypothetical protein
MLPYKLSTHNSQRALTHVGAIMVPVLSLCAYLAREGDDADVVRMDCKNAGSAI